jgi:hypothetical protein
VRLVDAAPARSTRILAQQQEMLVRLRTFQGLTVSSAALEDLNDATHEVTSELGHALRREGLVHKNVLVLEESGLGFPKPHVIADLSATFYSACLALAHDPAPRSTAAVTSTSEDRELLRSTLLLQAGRTPPRLRPITEIRRRSANSAPYVSKEGGTNIPGRTVS